MRDIQITPKDILQITNSIHLPNKNLFMHPDIWERFNKEQQDFLTNNFNKIGFSESLPKDNVYILEDTIYDKFDKLYEIVDRHGTNKGEQTWNTLSVLLCANLSERKHH